MNLSIIENRDDVNFLHGQALMQDAYYLGCLRKFELWSC